MGFVTVGGQAMLGHPRDDVFKISLKVREIRLTVNRFKKENIIGIENNSTVTRQWHTGDGIHEDIENKRSQNGTLWDSRGDRNEIRGDSIKHDTLVARC